MNATDTMIEELADLLTPGQRLLGLDLGSKTIGIAVSDATRTIATARETLKRRKFKADAEYLRTLAVSENAAAFILGLPVNMDGSEGPRAQSTRAFARNLASETRIPVVCRDERLSTRAVTRTLLEADSSRAKRAKVVDKMAAAYILQGALDHLRNLAPHREPAGSGAADL